MIETLIATLLPAAINAGTKLAMGSDNKDAPASTGTTPASDLMKMQNASTQSLLSAIFNSPRQPQQNLPVLPGTPAYDMYNPLPLAGSGGGDSGGGPGGGDGSFASGGYVSGPGGGLDDLIPTTINGRHAAKLSDGEFVVPADVVSMLGDGSSSEGARRLYDIVGNIRKRKTGTTEQAGPTPVGDILKRLS